MSTKINRARKPDDSQGEAWRKALSSVDGRARRVWRWGSPPRFLRVIAPWGLLYWLDSRYDLCWLSLAMWKMGYDWPWQRVSMRCLSGEPDGWDYCNKWQALGRPPGLTAGSCQCLLGLSPGGGWCAVLSAPRWIA